MAVYDGIVGVESVWFIERRNNERSTATLQLLVKSYNGTHEKLTTVLQF
jgi:hypothetical protein